MVERPNLVEVDLEVDLEVETWRMQEPLTKKIIIIKSKLMPPGSKRAQDFVTS